MENILVLATSSIAIKRLPALCTLLYTAYKVKIIISKKAKQLVEHLPDWNLNSYFQKPLDKELQPEHVTLANWAHHIIVYPATYNLINKYAGGIADDFLTTILATSDPYKVIICPAMHPTMYQQPVLQKSINNLTNNGVRFVGPHVGKLHCQTTGIGHISEPAEVFQQIIRVNKPRVLITAGATRSYLDAVRYVQVKSSGKMGKTLARQFCHKYEVDFLAVNIEAGDLPRTIRVISCENYLEYKQFIADNIVNYQGFISAAAVSDLLWPKVTDKITKTDLPDFKPQVSTDILAETKKKYPDLFCIGFALESTTQLPLKAGQKFLDKGVEILVGNEIETLGSDQTSGLIFQKEKAPVVFHHWTKQKLASELYELFEGRHR